MKATILALSALAALTTATPTKRHDDKKHHGKHTAGPFVFTSTYNVVATPDQVVNADNEFTGGLEGAKGWFNFGINSYENVICYNITLENFRGDYESPADTATHIHEAPKGEAGPPRIAFPNPQGEKEGRRTSIGCLTGPFETGIVNDGVDTGEGFHVKQIEADPAAFFADVHSSLAVPGAVRGQLSKKKDGCP